MSARKRLRRWRFKARDRMHHWRWVTIATVLNRFAPAGLRHAALLLGYDAGMGYGRVDVLLSHLSEFAVGENLASRVRYGEEWPELDPGRAAEMFRLERSLYGIIPGLVTR